MREEHGCGGRGAGCESLFCPFCEDRGTPGAGAGGEGGYMGGNGRNWSVSTDLWMLAFLGIGDNILLKRATS